MANYLIINADDFGYTPGINRGICDCYDEGVVSSVSVMATGDAFADAVERLVDRPGLGRGVHVTLTTMEPLLDPADLPTLVGDGGRFRESGFQFFLAYARGALSMDEIEREVRAQIEHVIDRVDDVDHLNGHMHVHMLPGLFSLFCDLAAEYDIPAVRVTDERFPLTRTALTNGHLADALSTPEVSKQLLLSALARYNGPTDHSPTRAFAGVRHVGGFTATRLHRLLAASERFPLEVAVHPGYVDDVLRTHPEPLLEGREVDLAGLTDESVRRVVDRKFDLVRFADLY